MIHVSIELRKLSFLVISQIYKSLVIVKRDRAILVIVLVLLVIQEGLLAELFLFLYESHLILAEMVRTRN